MTNFNKAKDNYFDLLNSDVSDEKYENTLISMEDYLHNCMTTSDDNGEIKYTYCPTSMLKDIYNLSDDEIFSLVLELGYHICQLFGDCEYEVQDYFIVKDEDSVNQLISDFENYLDFTPSYEIIPNVAYEECLKESKNKERPTKNQLKDWAKKHKKTNKKNAWGWWIFPNVEDGIKFFNHVMGSNSADGAEISGSSTEVSSADSVSAGVGESLTEDDTSRTSYVLTKEQLQKVKDVLKNNLNKLLEDNDAVISNSLPQGPSFILRDGRFVDVVESGKNFKNTYLDFEIVTHLSFLRNLISIVIDDYHNVRTTYSFMEDLAAYVTDILGVLRCNTGETDEEDRYYCVLPGRYSGAARPTNAQYSSLLQFLDYGVDNARDDEVLVFCGDADEYSKSETFNCKTPDNTLSAIKNFYRTGVLAEAIKFSNNALERMSKFVDSVKENKNLQLLNNQDTPICYESAVNNVFYFHRLGKDCILHLGTFDETGTAIVHAWVECEGKVYQTAEPKNKPKNYKLKSLKQIEISKDMSEDDIEKAIKSLYEKSESLKEAKEDIEKFINKFGQDIYDLFIKSKDRLKNNNISTDILFHVKNTSVEDMRNILHNLQSKVKSDDLTKIQGKYNYLGEVGGYKVYQPLDVIASMNLGVGSGWCTTGRYGHYGEINFKPSVEDAENHWDDYVTYAGIEFFYLLDAKTMLAKYAIALYPEVFEVNEVIDNLFIFNTNFEIFNAEDNVDYEAYFKLKNVTKLISEYFSYSDTLILDAVDIDKPHVLGKESIYNDVVDEKDINRKFKHLIIPQGVETIGNMAFADSELLESIELPNSLVNIGAYAFYNCINLKNIEIPDSVAYINVSAFDQCESLTDVVLPNNLSDIPDGLFYKCKNLRSVKIPKSIDSIGHSAFLGCSNLKNVIIPSSVIAIGDYAFAECSDLTIYCEMESKPDNWSEFWNPTNCPVVWNYKDGKNESLEEDVEIHDTLNSKFWKDNELKTEIREKIEAIVERFKTYLNNKNIKIDVKDILLLGSNASYNYTDDSDLDIHIIVESKEITEDEELLKQLYDLAASAFNDKFNITLKNSDAEVYVELNDTDAHSNGIYSLEKGWIKEPVKDELKNVELDKEELNKWKKRYQDVLEEKDAKKIKKFIAELYKLRKDSIAADGEYSQGNLIFKEMRNLGYISKLKELLDEIESKELSLETLTEAKEDIERFINKFGQDVYDLFIKSKDRLKNNKISTDIIYHVKNTSVEDMKTILHNLQAKVSSDDLTKIQGKYNYLGERNDYKVYQPLDALASMNLGVGSGWCTTGRYGHYGDEGFKPSLKAAEEHWNSYTKYDIEFYYLLDAKTMLAKYAIALYPGVFSVNKIVSDYFIEEANFEIYNAEDNLDYTAYFKLENVLRLIPESLIFKSIKLEEIGETIEAVVKNNIVVYSAKYTLASTVIIPENAEYIGKAAFRRCDNLIHMKMPDSVTQIGSWAFSECGSLENIEISSSVRSIKQSAFNSCASLKNITIPDSVIGIGNSAFAGCHELESIEIPDSVRSIGDSAFFECSSLKNVKLSDNLTNISGFLFSGCSSLTSIIIPNGVTRIDGWAFSDCPNLTIYCEAESQPEGWSKFWNSDNRPVVWNYKGKKSE